MGVYRVGTAITQLLRCGNHREDINYSNHSNCGKDGKVIKHSNEFYIALKCELGMLVKTVYWHQLQLYIIIIIIVILVITFMQGIYICIPETNHVSRINSVAAVLYVQFVLHVMLFRPWNMFCTFILALSAVCAQCPIWLFFAVPEFRSVLLWCSGLVWVILKWFELSLLLLVSLLLSHSTCIEFLLWGLYILKSYISGFHIFRSTFMIWL
jgi:hypothetical protein